MKRKLTTKKTTTKAKSKAKSPRKPSKVSKPKTASTPKISTAELSFKLHWERLYPHIKLKREHTFCPPRRFRFDFVSIESKVAIEINGGNWGRGRHTNPLALNSEYEKLNLAVKHGWRVFILSPEMINEDWLGAIAEAIQTQ